MSQIIRIRRGLDIKLKGKAEKTIHSADNTGLFAIKPTDFIGLIPKINVKEGEEVKIGTPLFSDKARPEIRFVSPVSGKVKEINRGEKRKILAVIIESDGRDERSARKPADPLLLSRDEVRSYILEGGSWPFIRQRPYNTIALPGPAPKSIVISGFDTAPLAPDINFIMQGTDKEFQTGINALKKLTDGNIYLNLQAGTQACPAFTNAKEVVVHYFSGPHPAGNPGIQLHHIDPLNKGEIVWVITPQNVASIGRLFLEGAFDNTIIIALTGSEVIKPAYYKVSRGISISGLLKDNVKPGEVRYISGNVLTGSQQPRSGFLGFYDNQLSIIPEGRYHDFLGWALPGVNKYSTSRSFFSWLTPGKEYRLDTNMKGAERAFVMSGQYEKVFPMKIYPVHLIKAILAENIDKMEQLGIYEVVEEDLALCEFVCTSKIEVQSILRKGLDLMKKEME